MTEAAPLAPGYRIGVPWPEVLEDLWRLNRVHVGPDMSETCARLAAAYAGSRVLGYPSGDVCGSWKVAPAWEVRAARLTTPDGRIVADWNENPLYLFAYSPSFTGEVSRADLEPHLLSDPARPNAIPFHFRNQYRYWAADWGFCLPDSVRRALPQGTYRVHIDTRLVDGRMDMVEQVHAGDYADSLLLVGHLDHPAMCNDGLVGCLAGHEALRRLGGTKTKLTYRMLSTIEIVGSVFFAEREAGRSQVREAMFIATAGARAPLAYQESAMGTAVVDRAARHLLGHVEGAAGARPFRSAFGNDEIAFDVTGIGIPCGSLMRFPYPEYHTSDDTPAVVDEERFEETVTVALDLVSILEHNATMVGRFAGLPCLSNPAIDLYLSPPVMSGVPQDPNATTTRLLERLPHDRVRAAAQRAPAGFFRLMNLLPAMAGGNHTTLDLAERAGVPFGVADAYTDMWVEKGLLTKTWIHPFGQV